LEHKWRVSLVDAGKVRHGRLTGEVSVLLTHCGQLDISSRHPIGGVEIVSCVFRHYQISATQAGDESTA
jgi:hypothetical protein